MFMLELSEILTELPGGHGIALQWFDTHHGQDVAWPGSLSNGTLLVSKPKGIYKPQWTKYALSVRQLMESPYPDRDPVVRPNGTWTYLYFQEKGDPAQRDTVYTNRGLVECMRDGVPVGVLRQVSPTPHSRYHVLGLAAVAGWEDGYFQLEGFSPTGVAYARAAEAEIATLLSRHEDGASDPATDYLEGFADEREFAVASVVRRRGQPEFRKALLAAYGGTCAISGCDAQAALEAAHIVPYRGPQSNSISNGIILRADLHTLFDLGLIAIDTPSMTVVVSPEIARTTYVALAGAAVAMPTDTPPRPTMAALDRHRKWSGLTGNGKLS